MEGVPVENSLSSVNANYYMEVFEKTVVSSAHKETNDMVFYVDGTFAIWALGDDPLVVLLEHL